MTEDDGFGVTMPNTFTLEEPGAIRTKSSTATSHCAGEIRFYTPTGVSRAETKRTYQEPAVISAVCATSTAAKLARRAALTALPSEPTTPTTAPWPAFAATRKGQAKALGHRLPRGRHTAWRCDSGEVFTGVRPRGRRNHRSSPHRRCCIEAWVEQEEECR
jgi:hypothetical protein